LITRLHGVYRSHYQLISNEVKGMKKSIYLLLMIVFSGCSDWLDVRPSDRVSEETAFSTVAGFKKALNGVYVDMNRTELYGQALTCEMLEILAQRYDINQENKDWTALMTYDYAGSYVYGRVEQIWGRAYSLIANTNLILKNCDERREVLPDDYYRMIKGEALALRGFLHFDLFRLFGPVYAKDSAVESIPYYKEFALSVNPSLTGTDFMKNVISDLKEAKVLLSDDPIITNGVTGDPSDKFKKDRNLRLNYYAVQGLLSRAYMYMGELDSALVYALNVIDIHKRVFPWVSRNNAVMGSEPDKIFSTEVLFGLQNKNVGSLYNSLFNGESLKISSLLAIRDNVINDRFEYQGEGDVRILSFLKNKMTIGGVDYKLFNKFESTQSDSLHSQMMPMIRISELYLIVAEIYDEKDQIDQGEIYFDELRENRGLSGQGEWYPYYLEGAWWKEFIGEGQLFYYYKRQMAEEMLSATSIYNPTPMKLSNYVLPLPNGETKYN